MSTTVKKKNKKKQTIKNTNIWRLNNTLLNNQQIAKEIKIFIDYLKKKEKSQINNLILHLKQLEK